MVDIVEPEWDWQGGFTKRQSTKYFIIHHTDGPQDQDVAEIFQGHVKNGWIGIGYHFVISKDGTVTRGRPLETVGAHALGLNYCSIGIAIEGAFQPNDNGNNETPSDEQIASCIALCKELYTEYTDAEIIGHRDVADIVEDAGDATACPGDTLYNMLPDIIKKVAA